MHRDDLAQTRPGTQTPAAPAASRLPRHIPIEANNYKTDRGAGYRNDVGPAVRAGSHNQRADASTRIVLIVELAIEAKASAYTEGGNPSFISHNIPPSANRCPLFDLDGPARVHGIGWTKGSDHMLLVLADRHDLVELVAPHPINDMVELGVYEGEFSYCCYKLFGLKHYTLIDFGDHDEYLFVLEDLPQMRGLSAAYNQYFHSDAKKALSAAYEMTRSRFAEKDNVEILKMDIANAADRFADGWLDFIYLDGNHTYEFVLRDLYTWFPRLRLRGLFACNDFFESSGAAQQYIGVIPASLTFSKRYKMFPIALTSPDWSDFYFSNAPTSDLIAHFKTMICGSRLPVVEVPDDLLGGYHHDLVQHPGQAARLVPSFGFRRDS